MKIHSMLLQLFAEEGAGSAAPMGGGADAGTAAETGEVTGEIRVGDTLGDGTPVNDAKVAAALNRQMNRHPELRKVYGQQRMQAAPAPVMAQGQQPGPQGQDPAAGQENQPDDLQARYEGEGQARKYGQVLSLRGEYESESH